MVDTTILLQLDSINKSYPLSKRSWFGGADVSIKAVTDISFSIAAGETLGLVGESGCGKSTLARLCALLHRPDSGSIRLAGTKVSELRRKQLKPWHRRVQLVFQDPFAALNPRLTVAAILTEPLAVHRQGNHAQRHEKAAQILRSVGLEPDCLTRYPHQFSGGQRQRIAIARALMLDPALIVADEAVSALDVSVQGQILNLLLDLKQQLKLAYLFISHDLAVVDHIADRVAVMYLGRIVEMAPRKELFVAPAHPYTRTLIAAIPTIRRGGKRRSKVAIGDVPSPTNPPPGCAYHTRCPKAQTICRNTQPSLDTAPQRPNYHQVACHFPESR